MKLNIDVTVEQLRMICEYTATMVRSEIWGATSDLGHQELVEAWRKISPNFVAQSIEKERRLGCRRGDQQFYEEIRQSNDAAASVLESLATELNRFEAVARKTRPKGFRRHRKSVRSPI